MVGGGGGEGSKQHRKKDEKIKIHFFFPIVLIFDTGVCVCVFLQDLIALEATDPILSSRIDHRGKAVPNR